VHERQTGKEVVGLAIINDVDREVKGEYLDALQSKCAAHILWSLREQIENRQKLLAA